jgi:nitrite reductase/ring-hydroxylating ferredoxin subunit
LQENHEYDAYTAYCPHQKIKLLYVSYTIPHFITLIIIA